jgi:UrcA family protein
MKTSIKNQTKIAKSILAASCFALGCIAIDATALAQQASATETQANSALTTNGSVMYPVRFPDLDMSKMKDAKTLYLRIRYAAEVVCENAATWGRKEGQACVNRAVDDAVSRLNRPLLTQYHQLRTKGDKTGLVQLAKAH